MKSFLKRNFKGVFVKLKSFGFDLRKVINLRYYNKFRKQKKEWIRQGGRITHHHMKLSNYFGSAGTAKGQYFHQDLIVAKYVYLHNPIRHLDIASRVDGFVAHVAAFREIEVADIRPLSQSEHDNIKFVQADLINSQSLGLTDSLSCLHAIEHFGLGRYNDPIDINGHIKGITNLVNLLKKKGRFYISFPISSKEEIHFNAGRVLNPTFILSHESIKDKMQFIRFDYVDDKGDLHLNTSIQKVEKNISLGCGIYTFEKL